MRSFHIIITKKLQNDYTTIDVNRIVCYNIEKSANFLALHEGGVRQPMAQNDLKRLSRRELIEIIYALKEREEELMEKNRRLEEALNKREFLVSTAGSIAGACLQINQIFEQAQAAADDYVRSVKAAADRGILKETQGENQDAFDKAMEQLDPAFLNLIGLSATEDRL